ncbi:MAG: GNAT family N-acetyltransferase, partial [Rhodothermales bacterium]|nr:GNAT family N-acetyltransferase [Rhodothermales bacterium]
EDGFLNRSVRKIRLGEAAPNYLTPGLDPRYTHAMVFFERRGYKRFGETWNLCVDLEELTDDPPWLDPDIIVRRATKSDRPKIMRLLEKNWSAWKPEIGRTFENEPVSLHIALHSDNVVAFSAFDANNFGTGWFGPMGTDPEYRGRGLGALLLKRCLYDVKAQGHSTATIPWVGPIGFYCKHVNATVDRVFYRYEKVI